MRHLSAERWSTPLLSAGWSVHGVLAHLIGLQDHKTWLCSRNYCRAFRL
ncbi:maleylpyruvate isomerase N-terminal domain-containing protein [Renibacterium salmoninarum]|nr:maleylpyruvate isomerase N-terminal domain-containing protein [Renibacterium salmoninarum]